MKDEIEKLTTQEYWISNFSKVQLVKFGENIYSKTLKKYLPYNKSATCIEIGGYPGHLLGWMAKEFGYQPTALDYVPEINSMRSLFEFNGITNLQLINEDFLKFKSENKYDVVASFGFIEHFDDYKQIIKLHKNLVKDNGYLVIGVPFLGGLQLFIRKLLYKRERYEEVMRIHNRKIMNLKELKQTITNEGDMELLFAKYIGEMEIWFGEDQVQTNRIFLYRIIKKVSKLVSKLGFSNKLISPLILVIAKKH